MKRKVFLVIRCLIITACVSAYFCYRSGLFPAAVVNWNIITHKSISDSYQLNMKYLAKTASFYNSDLAILTNEATQKEIMAAIISEMIEDSLIYKEAKNKVGKDLKTVADQKINNVLKERNIEEAVNVLYETTLANYIQKELMPQAYREILEGRMTLNNENFGQWLENEKSEAKIIVFIPGYHWDGKNVKIEQ